MKIIVKNIKGQPLPLDLSPELTILDLKAILQQQKGYDINYQKIICKGKIPENSATLLQIGLQQNDALTVMVTKKTQLKTQSIKIQPSSLVNQKKLIKIQEKPQQLKSLPSFPTTNPLLNTVNLNNNNQNNNPSNLTPAKIAHLQNVFKLYIADPQLLVKIIILDKYLNIFKRIGSQKYQINQPTNISTKFSQNQKQSIQRLINLGFTQNQVQQAFFACNGNQQMAANLLFDQYPN